MDDETENQGKQGLGATATEKEDKEIAEISGGSELA
jgi:hypothetical protein